MHGERDEAGKVPRSHVEPTTLVIRLCTSITLAWADDASGCLQALEGMLHIFRERGDLSEMKRLRSTDGVRGNA